MGRRGPPPTPTSILKLRGSWRGKARKGEPRAPDGRPPCPTWLRPEAKAAWKRLVPILERMNVLTLADGLTLARYCEMWAQWQDLAVWAQEGDLYCHTESGMAIHPKATLLLRYGEALTRLEDRFGLSPSARARLAIAKEEDDKVDPVEGFFGTA